MSYRSFKRALGETSLERKCRWLFGACLWVLITGSFWFYGSRTEVLVHDKMKLLHDKQRLLEDRERASGRHLVDAIMLHYHWMKLEPQEKYKPMIDALGRSLQTQQYNSWRLLKPGSSDPQVQPQNEVDARVLARFSRSQPQPEVAGAIPEFDEYRSPELHEFHYYQPIRARQECMLCHQSLGPSGQVLGGAAAPDLRLLREGDLLAVVKVVIHDDESQDAMVSATAATSTEGTQLDAETQTALHGNRAILMATAIITVFLAMIASFVIIRYVIVKPLKHLRDVSDEVSRGNIEARAEINTADEFEELGVAFNKMLRHLVTAQDELRSVNTNLDGKVDELAQANMRLYELNRLKSDFLATMSHELRTPLNSIIGFSDVLGSIKSLDDKQKRYVQNIQKSGRVLLDMINDILDLAKIESGKMELRLTDFSIENAITAQCDMARPLTERKNIDLEIDVEPGLPELYQDQGKVQQTLNNLLSNAIKFTPEGGRIVVSARRETGDHRDELVLTVADTGVGIAEEDQVSIFEKFRQGKTSLAGGDAMTREYSGTGLGLSIVRELCKLLGGEVSLQSELGKGSTFTVRLPWVRADQPKLDSPMAENIDELIRPRRVELQRSLDRPVPAAPTVDSN